MIFVTVGTDQPFDRLVRAVDQWARENNRTDVFAQIGETKAPPTFIAYSKFIEPPEYAQRFASASIVVSHAGMGTILSALRWEKPILVMPRVASLGEHRNEHQLATARHLSALGKVNVAIDEIELRTRLDQLGNLKPKDKIGPYASESLVSALREFIARGK